MRTATARILATVACAALLAAPVLAAETASDLVLRAHLLGVRGDWKGAVALLDRAIATNPESAEAYRERGRARLELEAWTGSLQDLERAVALDPTDAEARFLVGWWYAADGKDKRAADSLE